MVSANLDTLELELRKLDGVRTVGFSTQHDVLYIQLFIEANAPAATLPFEATRIAQRHSSSPVAVELVRWSEVTAPTKSNTSGLGSIFENTQAARAVSIQEEQSISSAPLLAGSIGSTSASTVDVDSHFSSGEESISSANAYKSEPELIGQPEQEAAESGEELLVEATGSEALDSAFADDADSSPISKSESNSDSENNEVDITFEDSITDTFESALEEEPTFENRREDDGDFERIELLLVTTSAENDEIEVHLSFDELRTIGRAPTNRGLLGAIDATVLAIAELTGSDEFHAEWARSLEPGAEHASLVAVGLTNAEGTDTRHGIAGGSSPIEAASRATLNALNRTAVLSLSE